MANIIGLPPTVTFTVDQALDSAKSLDLTEVLVIGYDADGGLLIRSSRMSRRDALWLVESAKAWSLQSAERDDGKTTPNAS